MEAILKLDALLVESGKKEPLQLEIYGPEQGPGGDYFCRIHAPALFANDKDIFGVDQEQAKSLTVDFINTMLLGKQIIDEQGNNIRLSL